MTSYGYVFVGLCCALFGAFCIGYAAGRAEARAGWWEKRRELLRRFYGDTERGPW